MKVNGQPLERILSILYLSYRLLLAEWLNFEVYFLSVGWVHPRILKRENCFKDLIFLSLTNILFNSYEGMNSFHIYLMGYTLATYNI